MNVQSPTETPQSGWSHNELALTHSALPPDPLLACLILVAQIYERPCSADALLAGLPLVDGRLTPALLIRAADRIALTARLFRRPISELNGSMLPAVLLTHDRRACIATAVDADGQVTITNPSTGALPEKISFKDLSQLYDGHMILLRPQVASRQLESDHDTQPKSGSWFWGTLAGYWPIYLQVALVAVFVNVFAISIPLVSMNVYDRVVPNNAVETLWVLVIGGVVVLTFDMIMRTLRGYMIDIAGRRADHLLSAYVMGKVLDMRLAARPASAGSFANNLREFETLRDFFTSATLATIVDLPFSLLFIFAIFVIGGPLASVALIIVPIVVLVGLGLQIPLTQAFQMAHKQSAMKHGVLIEIIGGLETIKSLGASSRMQRLWEMLVDETSKVGQKTRMISSLAVNFSSTIQQIGSIVILAYGVYLIKDGKLTSGGLVASSMLLGRALAPLSQVASLLTRYHQSMSALKGLDKIMETPGEHGPQQRYLNRPIRHGAIEFRKVTFSYPGANLPSLENVSFRIQPGERIGIIGRIGSGKSTIARLILNLYQPSEGAVMVDGADVRQIDPADLRRGIGLVPQDIFLFQGSVRDNIAVRVPHIDDDQLLRAARISGVDDFVAPHPAGYDLPVGERGERLSGGQRQAIVVARALIGDPPILILDEPTSAMDNSSERDLKKRIVDTMPGRTIVLITHRASLLDLITRLIVMDGGKIIADGPRDQVLQALSEGRLQGAPR